MLLGSVLGLERPNLKGILGVGFWILGVSIVVYGGLRAQDDSLIGNLVILLAALCVGIYTVFSMPMLERHSPLAVATYPTLFGGPVVLLLVSPYFTVCELGGTWASALGRRWATQPYSPPPSPSPAGRGGSAVRG